MNHERSRLLSLIEFSQQTARLLAKPPASLPVRDLFATFEHQIQGLPGIRTNLNDPESGDEIWLTIERLYERRPPDIASVELRPWVEMTQEPTKAPQLLESIDYSDLIAAGHPPDQSLPPNVNLKLSDYDKAALVRTHFTTYLETKWRPWAEEEKLRRKTIRIYSDLFTLKQELEGSIIEAQLELVWGVGLGIWNSRNGSVNYPLIGRLVEMSLNPKTAELEIRPRDLDARIEIDCYASHDNPGVADLEKAATEFFGKATTTFSPFDHNTFEPLLRTAAVNLDANGIYWPDEVSVEDRALPKASDNLKVTDTWVLFARPRGKNLFLQDLENLKKRVEVAESYPPAVAAVVTDPDTTNQDIELPLFRGVSASYHSDPGLGDKKVRDLYFPKPFNDEQVRIVQLLDIHDGVVVQGPPGTGKTHTIANVICHYLAEGKRVLVTSMRDPALAVLQKQLPDEIRPLAISLLTSEQDGMQQFEYSIKKIASEVQGLDRGVTARAIKDLEESIDDLHGKLASTDRRVGEWAKRNLVKITLETEEIEPQDAAREVVGNIDEFEWITDSLGVAPEFAPQFTDADVVRLRDARRILGRDIDYLGVSLPQVVEFADAKALLEVHQDLSQFEKLKQDEADRGVPTLADSSLETLTLAQDSSPHIEALRRLRSELLRVHRPWMDVMRERLHLGGNEDLLKMLEALGAELEQAAEWRKSFIKRPVATPAGIEFDDELSEAVRNLSEGKSPFGLKGLFGKSAQKHQLDGIRVLGNTPADAESWKHVAGYLALLQRQRKLALRWNALAHELQLEAVVGDNPEGGQVAANYYAHYLKVKNAVEEERELCVSASRLFPNWAHAREVADSPERLAELELALRHHLTKNRLANVWSIKEGFQRVMEGRSGRVIQDIRLFLSNTLGNPHIEDAQMQAGWSDLMAELSRVLRLGGALATVNDVCSKVEASGAPKYAISLKQPLDGPMDHLLPDNWRAAWRMRRLETCLQEIDAQKDLKKLAKTRQELEGSLSRAYRDVVVKRTWLKLAENASPSIRAALQAYLNAVQKIGKGTGKRAVRYRQDARMAASQANPAVPCWIMPHYRVSESLPAELGCFDLVIIDEASQSDLTALPSLLRAKKVLIVGDDKQVSPEGVGLEEDKIRSLMSRFLVNQVATYRPQMSPERSIYDLFKVVFAKSSVMLKEHFRCVGPIIEYSKREFYNHELSPLRVPKASERLDPPLIDVVVENGYRSGDINKPEARFIVDEIKAIVADPNLSTRSIGIVSLHANKQAQEIWQKLTDEIGTELIQRHHIECGDARTFQGKERDIMFLSMVSAPNEVGAPLSRDTFSQRFNVAASRARDRMYLVRSVGLEHLSAADRFRRSLIGHFTAPFTQDEVRVEDLRKLCESDFEREMYDELTQRGFWVTPQVRVGQYRIDMVVEGHNDARLAVECDGDKYHGPDKWADDMQRQRNLERAGWMFWRCFASAFFRRRSEILGDLLKTLTEHGIEPIGSEGAPRSVHSERRVVFAVTPPVRPGGVLAIELTQDAPANEDAPLVEARVYPSPNDGYPLDQGEAFIPSVKLRDWGLPFSDYSEYSGVPGNDPRSVDMFEVSEGIRRIVEIEGPVVAKRVYDIYLRGCGIQRMGHELQRIMNQSLAYALRQGHLVSENESSGSFVLSWIVRVNGSPSIRLRSRGPRSFEEIPPSELQAVAIYLVERGGLSTGSDEHLRAVLEFFDLKRLTTQVGTVLLEIIDRKFSHVDEFLNRIPK